jgi:hypothetical protein
MAAEKNTGRDQTGQAAAAKQAGTQPPRGDVTEQRGGAQADQIGGETAKGAHNQDTENRNPSGHNPNRNQSSRQEGNTL